MDLTEHPIPSDSPRSLDEKAAGRQHQTSPNSEPPVRPYALHGAAVAVALAWAILVVLGLTVIATLGWHTP